jgi:hypothetical protein
MTSPPLTNKQETTQTVLLVNARGLRRLVVPPEKMMMVVAV